MASPTDHHNAAASPITAQHFPSIAIASTPTAISTPPSSTAQHRPSAPATSPASPHDALPQPSSAEHTNSASRRLRKLHISPGLRQRLQLLDRQNKRRVASGSALEADKIGRIPEDHIKQLDEAHRRAADDHNSQLNPNQLQQQQTPAGKGPPPGRVRAWSGPAPPRLALGETGENFEASVTMDAYTLHDTYSDVSSMISTSEPMIASASEDEVDVLETDTSKFLLPDIGKTRESTHAGAHVGNEHVLMRGHFPPTPPPKDTPSRRRGVPPPPSPSDGSSEEYANGGAEFFNPCGLSRTGSIYTLSRVSFTSQLSQLTSIRLPNAATLSASVSSIPTAKSASRVLRDGADQIGLWIRKALEVLDGLDAEDDVEWAAAGGREGLAEVDAAIKRFESLIDMFVTAIDELQQRQDITDLPQSDLQELVTRMESILNDWKKIKTTLQNVREQVELAMEWEELWNTVLGEVGLEIDSLNRLIFEMEERRHRNILSADAADGDISIGELETIVEEAPARNAIVNKRFSLATTFTTETSPVHSPIKEAQFDDSKLMALFARMQPLKASLDFLPMRLSLFATRGRPIFPSACDELENRKVSLESQWKKLELDAESLRRELGEDQWILVFRRAGTQALKMCESIKRTLAKLHETLEDGAQHMNIPAMAKRVENYEAKKMHYGPAIERVLAIIDRGVKDRLTVNGEILRLQTDMKRKWTDLEEDIRAMDYVLTGLRLSDSYALRDSISTILSTDRSVGSSAIETPTSSPASSIVFMNRAGSDYGMTTPQTNGRNRQSSFNSNKPTTKRYSSLPTVTSSPPRKTPMSHASFAGDSPSPANRYASPTPVAPQSGAKTGSNIPTRPRWNSSTSMNGTQTGHNFKPLTLTTPSPYRKSQIYTSRSNSRTSMGPISPLSATAAQATVAGAAGFRSPSALATPSVNRGYFDAPSPDNSPLTGILAPKLRTVSSPSVSSQSGLPTLKSFKRTSVIGPPSPPVTKPPTRPGSVAASRRLSMLPTPKKTPTIPSSSGRDSRAGTGRESRSGSRLGRPSIAGAEEKRPWR